MCFHEKKKSKLWISSLQEIMALFGRGYEPHLTPLPLLKANISGVIRLFLSSLSGLAWSEKGSSREKTDVLVILKGDYK